jgi:hypothetical protein
VTLQRSPPQSFELKLFQVLWLLLLLALPRGTGRHRRDFGDSGEQHAAAVQVLYGAVAVSFSCFAQVTAVFYLITYVFKR